MCGIAGILTPNPQVPVDGAMLQRMTKALYHRGPDGDGFFIGDGIGLGHRRLAIIDPEGGAQPMVAPDDAAILSYNGEIYNFQLIQEELKSKGYVFKTDSDTEVLLASYLVWGEDCVHRFRGMFAFAIWDNRQKTLFVARDRLGIKPLHYAITEDGSFLFGSEIKALLASGVIKRKLRLDAVEDFMALSYVPDPKSIFSQIHKLAPGHRLTFRQGDKDPKIVRYWRPPISSTRSAQVSDDLLIRLEEAVRLRMISDVDLGAFLSGGVDSSAIVMLMAGLSKDPVKTCSIGSDVSHEDESFFADEVAEMFNTSHRNRFISVKDRDLLDILSDCYDEPFADNSALPTYRVCSLAKESVTVALSGDGGDEIFGGYRRYQMFLAEEKLRGTVPFGLRRALFSPLAAVYPKLDWAPRFLRAKSTFESLSMDRAEAYFHAVARGVDRDRLPLYSDHFKCQLGGYRASDRFKQLADEIKGADAFSTIQYIDLNTYIPGCILTKVDRASMANSLEVRVPLLDHEFMTWALTLDPKHCLDSQMGKKPLRNAIRGRVPDSVLDRKKQGFSIPVDQWLRSDWSDMLDALCKSEALMDTGLFNQKQLERMVREHQTEARNHGDILWSALVLDKMIQRYDFEL